MAGKKVVKKQTGGSAGQKAEARRDSIYNANKARTKAKMDSLAKIDAPTGRDTVKVGSTRVTVAKKKMGGSTKKKY